MKEYKDLFLFTADHTCVHVHQWAGKILEHAKLCKTTQDLEGSRRKILLISALEIMRNMELFKELAKTNYFIISHVSEISSNVDDIIDNIPEARDFLFLLGGRNTTVKSINLDTFYFLTQTDSNVMRAKYYTTNEIFQKRQKPYKFLYLNGADHDHRNVLWKKMSDRGLLSHALSSYLGYNGLSRDKGYVCDIPFKKLPEIYDSPYAINVTRPKATATRSTYSQFKQGSWQGLWVDGDIIPKQYGDTYFSLVTETTARKMFITEKTYKPILAGHPFILLGAPGIYKYLRDIGFQTFSPIIDESFDEVDNQAQKMQMIIKQVEKLCRSDLSEFLEKVKPICRHNQEFYISNRDQFFYKKHLELSRLIENTVSEAEDFFVRRGL